MSRSLFLNKLIQSRLQDIIHFGVDEPIAAYVFMMRPNVFEEKSLLCLYT